MDSNKPESQHEASENALAMKRAADTDPLINDRTACDLLGISQPTFWRRVADGTIPKPLKIGHLSRWPTSEVLAVVEKAKAARSLKEEA